MKFRLAILLFFLCLQSLPAQSLKIGASVAASNYSGDLTKDQSAIIRQTSAGFGISATYDLDQFLSIKFQYENLKISANDAISNQDWQKKRDLNFSSKIHSFDFIGQINLKNLLKINTRLFNVYLVGGYSFFNFNPMTNYNGKEYALRNLGTEGQGMKGYQSPYGLIAGAINFGGNLEFILSRRLSLQAQLLFRKTNTDYLDDISNSYVDYNLLSQQNGKLAAELGNKIKAPQGSQRGNPIDNDWYQSLSLGLHYKIIDKTPKSSKIDNKRAVHCPKFR